MYVLTNEETSCSTTSSEPSSAQLCLNWWSTQNPVTALASASRLSPCPCTLFHAVVDPNFLFTINTDSIRLCAISRSFFSTQVGIFNLNSIKKFSN